MTFKEKIQVKEEDTKNYFICTDNNINALMYKGETGFVVLKGSIVAKDEAPYLERKYGLIYKKRIKYKETRVLKPFQDKFLELTEDQEFNSSSSAGIFVSGKSVNGYIVWRKKDNPDITYGDFLQIKEL